MSDISQQEQLGNEPQEREKPEQTQTSAAAPESLRILEAVLFSSEEVMTVQKLKSIIPDEPDARAIKKMVDTINIQLQRERHPFEIVELAGGYQFRTIPYYQPWVQQILKEKSVRKLSIQALECLAIIAYKQPISKAEIEAIRGVLSEGAMKTLLERHMITISGRSDKAGRPLLYSTTLEFLKYFGINKLADLPKMEEFEAIAREKMDEISDEELTQLGIPSEITTDESESGAQQTSPAAEGATETVPKDGSPTTEEIPAAAEHAESSDARPSQDVEQEDGSEHTSDTNTGEKPVSE